MHAQKTYRPSHTLFSNTYAHVPKRLQTHSLSDTLTHTHKHTFTHSLSHRNRWKGGLTLLSVGLCPKTDNKTSQKALDPPSLALAVVVYAVKLLEKTHRAPQQ